MARRLGLVLATVAALLGAPPSVGAASSALAALPPTPVSGTTETAFTFRAAYGGRFAATSVIVEVAGLTLPTQLESGTPTQGTWSVTTGLPAGTWSPTFRALVVQGSAPTVVGAPVTVATVSTAPATAVATPGGGDAGPAESPDTMSPERPGDVAPTPSDPTSPPAMITPPAAPPAAGPSSGPSTGPFPSSSEVATPAAPPAAPNEGAAAPIEERVEQPPSAAAVPGTSTPTASRSGAPGSVWGGRPGATEQTDGVGGTPDGRHDEGTITPAAVVGLTVTGAAAVLGLLVALLARRRQDKPVPAAAEPIVLRRARSPIEPRDEGPRDPTAELLDRRARRRAHLVLPADPIVAALGVDQDAPSPPSPPEPRSPSRARRRRG